jgi:hypothetical protein
MLSLAKGNYAKAYYPLAEMYFNKGDMKNAKIWAIKAINSNSNRKKAQRLKDKIEPKLLSNDELFASASTIEDFKFLADKGYYKAYVPLAELYLKKYDYDNALRYASKSNHTKAKRIQEAVKKINLGNRNYLDWKKSNDSSQKVEALYNYRDAVRIMREIEISPKSTVVVRMNELNNSVIPENDGVIEQ